MKRKQIIVNYEMLQGCLRGRRPEAAKTLGVHIDTLSRNLRLRRLKVVHLNQLAVFLDRDVTDFISISHSCECH